MRFEDNTSLSNNLDMPRDDRYDAQEIPIATPEPKPKKRGRQKKEKLEIVKATSKDKPLAFWVKKQEKLQKKLEKVNAEITRIGELEIDAIKARMKAAK